MANEEDIIAKLKAQYEAGGLEFDGAVLALQEAGYAHDDAEALVVTWMHPDDPDADDEDES